jgi:hypothetical protein
MKQLRIPLRLVLYREGEHWIAHCLELDLVGDGATHEEAVRMMCDAIFTQLNSCVKHKAPHALFSPAEAKYFEMFAAGKDIAVAELLVSLTERPLDSVTIGDVEAREYSDSLDTAESDSNLVCA